jgi:hypothetical protein
MIVCYNVATESPIQSPSHGRQTYILTYIFISVLIFLGGDKSIIMSLELPEDDPITGKKDLQKLETGTTPGSMVFIGITCGLSAPYAMGQIDYAMHNETYAGTVLLGFNPTSFARNVPVEGWDKTCFSVTQELASNSVVEVTICTYCYIDTPVESEALYFESSGWS